MTTQELAQAIRAKNPQYNNIDDTTLTTAWIKKYPVYQSHLDDTNQTDISSTTTTDNKPKGFWGTVADGAKAVGNFLTSSEQSFGKTLGTAASVIDPVTNDTRNQITAQSKTQTDNYLHLASQETNPTRKKQLLSAAVKAASIDGVDIYSNPEYQKTAGQIIGEGAGVALDALSAGSYGEAAKGAETGKLLTKSGGVIDNLATKAGIPTTAKFVAPVAENVVKKSLGTTLKDIGIKSLVRAGEGAGTGYGYDVAQNLQDGKTGGEAFTPGMGTLIGGSVPLVIGGVQAGIALSKETAPKFINSLIKPKQADFSYGKDPGRTVSELGITGNSLSSFADHINNAKQDIGNQLGNIYSHPENSHLIINAEDEIAKLDKAMETAAKGGKENQGLVTTLQNIKDALLYEHGINADGQIEKLGTTPRDLSKLNPEEAFNLKKIIAEHTKFTGKPSDDKTINSVLKSMYGSLKEKLNNEVGVNNPEILKLNQQYADLTSAELATRNREAIVKRADMVSLKSGAAGALGATAAILTGAATLPVTLVGLSAAALEKALETTAVKTRIAAWLGSEKPNVIAKIVQQNPAIKTTLYRLMPKVAGTKINKNN